MNMKKIFCNFANKFKRFFSKSVKKVTAHSNGCGCHYFEDNL